MGLIRSALIVGAVGTAVWHFTHPLVNTGQYGDRHEYAARQASPDRGGPFFVSSRSARLSPGEAIYFAPADDLERVDIALIDTARSSISVAMYAFTDRALASALARAAGRGVQVRVYRDRGQFTEEQRRPSGTLPVLLGEPAIQVRVKRSDDLMHEKAMLIDASTLRDGSGNWSVSAARYQDNQVSVTHDPQQIAQFRRNFEAMWSRPDNTVVR